MKKWNRMKSAKAMLGIVFYKNTIAVCQAHAGGRHQARPKPAVFTLANEKADLGDLPAHTAGFREFIKAHGFSARRAVVGLDAGRIFSTLFSLPPVRDAGMVEEIVRMQMERSTQLDMDEIVFGHVMSGDKVFAAAMLKKHLDQIKAFLQACGIRPVCVTSASLAAETELTQSPCCTVLEYPRSVELLFTQGGQVVGLRDISGGSDVNAFLPRVFQEVNRFSLTQREKAQCVFKLSSAAGVHAGDAVRRLFEGASVQTVAAATGPEDLPGAYAQRLGERSLTQPLPAVNFLAAARPRKKQMHSTAWLKRGVVAAAVVIVAALLFAVEWQIDRSRIADYEQQIASLSDNVKTAEKVITQTGYARQWFRQDPVYLNLLAELTNRFPERGSIWLNSVAVDESLNQVITGRASGEQAVLDVVDNLKSSSLFKDIKILYIRQAGKNTREETFAISFRFVPEN